MSKVLIVKNKDKRIKYIIENLKKQNVVIEIDDELKLFYEISDKNSDCLILPIRGINKELIIDGTDIKLTDNYFMLLSGKKIFTGLINEELKNKCDEYGIKLISYLTDDLAIKNNYITTEGIIEAIVNNSEKAIFNSNVLIIGYGKLGQIVAKVFSNMKSNITVSARHEKDLLHAVISDYNTINNNQIIKYIDKYDFIINTIPYRILDSNMLDKINGLDVLIIDVSSAPYGLDHEIAKSKNIKTLLLPGIPGKIAPLTAGYLIGEFINNNLGGGES